jgi:bifunctional non-homologous end joining protein LigD
MEGTSFAPSSCVPPARRVLPEPMYATLGHDMPRGEHWTFEPKYDGMRVLAECSARSVRLVTRNGKEKGEQFPEIVRALRALAAAAGRSVTLDGEIVAQARRRSRSGAGSGAGSGTQSPAIPEASAFQQLQSRMHLQDRAEIGRLALDAPATIVAFDILRDGRSELLALPWMERRARLERLFADADLMDRVLLLGQTSADGAPMERR